MGIKPYKPDTPGRRFGSVSDFADLTDRKKKPETDLAVPARLPCCCGRQRDSSPSPPRHTTTWGWCWRTCAASSRRKRRAGSGRWRRTSAPSTPQGQRVNRLD
jgi:hypothetical protein